MAEVEKVAEKPEEEESPAEDESNSDEDEVIPDIGGVPSLPSPPAAPGHRFCVSSLPLCGAPVLTSSPPAPLSHSQPSLSLSPLPPRFSHLGAGSSSCTWAGLALLWGRIPVPELPLTLQRLSLMPLYTTFLPWKSPVRRLRCPFPSRSSWWTCGLSLRQSRCSCLSPVLPRALT